MRNSTIIAADTGKVIVDDWTFETWKASSEVPKTGHTIGRCRRCEIAVGWKTGPGARLADARCIFCHDRLDQTTLALNATFWLLSPDTVVTMVLPATDDGDAARSARAHTLRSRAEALLERRRIQQQKEAEEREARNRTWAEKAEARRRDAEQQAVIASNTLPDLADAMVDAVRERDTRRTHELAQDIEKVLRAIDRGI